MGSSMAGMKLDGPDARLSMGVEGSVLGAIPLFLLRLWPRSRLSRSPPDLADRVETSTTGSAAKV